MPRSKDIAHYPTQYFDVTEAAALRGEVLVTEMPTMRQALSLRGQYYAFVSALRRAKDTIMIAGAHTENDQRICDLAQFSFRVLVTVEAREGGRAAVIFQNRDNSWQAQAMKRMVVRKDENAEQVLPSAALLAAAKAQKEKGK